MYRDGKKGCMEEKNKKKRALNPYIDNIKPWHYKYLLVLQLLDN